MKILMALNGLDIGGAETHVVELSREIKRRGHEVVMVSSGGVYTKEVEDSGIKHYNVCLTSRSFKSILDAKKQLMEIISKEKPDLVHSHARIPGFILDSIHKEMNKPFVFVTTVHATFDTSPLVKSLTRWGEKTLAVSDDLKKYLLKYYKEVKEENVYVSINGIDGNKFSENVSGEKVAKEFNLTPDAKRIVYVSRLDSNVCAPAYGIIEKIDKISKAVPGVEVIIVGNGDSYEDLCIKADTANKSLGRRAIIMANQRTDINEIHANADVCVGVSRAILEPMIMSKKCVIAGQEGYLGILNPEKLDTAILCNFTCRGCDKLDFDIMADDIIHLLTMGEEESKKTGAYNKSIVENHYSIKKMADDNLQMYCDALRDCRTEATILGYYGYGNSGDDALLKAIISDVRNINPFFTPVVLTHDVKSTEKTYNVECVDRFNVIDVLKSLEKSKMLILGGGSLIQDITSTKSIRYYLWCIRQAKKLGLKVMLYANGIGPVIKAQNIKRARHILNKADVITLRDEDSKKTLENIGVTKPEISVTADPAFSLTPCSKERSEEILKEIGIDQKYICMSVRNWNSASDKTMRNFAKMADYFSKKYSLIPLFIPMQHSKDKEISNKIISYMTEKGLCLNEQLPTDELLGVIGNATAVVAVRLHMLIFGAISGVPSMGIEYDPKIKGFLNSVNSHFSISPESLEQGDFEKMADEFMENLSPCRENLKKILPEMKEKSFLNAKIATELLNK